MLKQVKRDTAQTHKLCMKVRRIQFLPPVNNELGTEIKSQQQDTVGAETQSKTRPGSGW